MINYNGNFYDTYINLSVLMYTDFYFISLYYIFFINYIKYFIHTYEKTYKY